MTINETTANSGNNTSGSVRIKEYLMTISDVTSTFTSADIMEALPLVSKGSVTGYLAKLSHAGVIKEVGRNGRANIYQIVGNLEDQRTRNVHSSGGAEGRHIVGVSRKTRLINSLISLASEIEKMKGDLTDFTTKEILHELEKRTIQNV